MLPMIRCCLGRVLLMTLGSARADGPRDNLADNVRPVPPKGIAIADADRAAPAGRRRRAGQADRRAARIAPSESPTCSACCPTCRSITRPSATRCEYDEFFQAREIAGGEGPAEAGPGAGRPVARGPGALEHGDRAGRARLCLEDRRLGPALWPGRAGIRTGRTRRIDSGSTSGATAAART